MQRFQARNKHRTLADQHDYESLQVSHSNTLKTQHATVIGGLPLINASIKRHERKDAQAITVASKG